MNQNYVSCSPPKIRGSIEEVLFLIRVLNNTNNIIKESERDICQEKERE